MTVARSHAFAAGLYAAVSGALAGEGSGGADIPVYDSARRDPPDLFARIDSQTANEVAMKTGGAAEHRATVHLFHKAASRVEIMRLVALLDAALRGATIAEAALSIEGVTYQSEETGEVWHAMLRVSAWLGSA